MNKHLKILIVEDDVLISEHLKMILEDLGHSVSNVCYSFKDAVNSLNTDIPDFAFLDIRMNGIDEGIEVAKELNKIKVPFVFLTSFSDKQTLMDAIIQNPIGYILKPFSKDDITKIITKIYELLQIDFIEVGNSNKINRIKINEILFLKSDNVYVEVVCNSNKYVVRGKLNELHEKLPKNKFLRVNQSYVINIDKVKTIQRSNVQISNIEIPLSKKYRQEILEYFQPK